MTHIAIVGSGIVGTATGKGLQSVGHEVVFCDVSEKRLAALRAEGFEACHTHDLISRRIDSIMLTIATPTVGDGIDLSALLSGTRDVAKVLAGASHYITVIVRSTVLPGTTEDILRPILEDLSEKKAGVDFGLCMSPEFLRAETPDEDFLHPRGIVIGGIDEESIDAAAKAFSGIHAQIIRCSPREAEMMKYVSNIFDASKIAFFNEMRVVCDTVGIDAENVFPGVTHMCEACWNPTYGTKDMGPFEGMCFPKDTRAFLTWSQKRLHLPMRILEADIRENDEMKKYFPVKHSWAKLRTILHGWGSRLFPL